LSTINPPTLPAMQTITPENNQALSKHPEQKPASYFAPDRVSTDRLNPHRLNMTINDQKFSLEMRPEVPGPRLQHQTADSARSKRSVDDHHHTSTGKRPINLHIVIHEDLKGVDRNQLFNEHFSWLKTELEEISGRDIHFSFLSPHEMRHMNYKHEDFGKAGQAWAQEVEDLRDKLGFDPDINKFLLLTKDDLAKGVAGTGVSDYAIAKAHSVAPAHEVGHMFGATHEDAENYFNKEGKTISSLYGESVALEVIRKIPQFRRIWGYQPSIMNGGDGIQQPQGQAYRFSDKNRENIRNYLKNIP